MYVLQATGGGGGDFLSGLLQFGALGLMLGWFALRNEKLTQQLTRAVRQNTQTLALVLQVITLLQSHNIPPEVRERANEALTRITRETDGDTEGAA